MSDLHVPGYDLGDLLGYGATGEVWAARDRVSHAAVALKRMRAPDDEARERLLREATVLSRVSHPHVVRLIDVVPVDDGVVLVLERAAGGSLRRLLAERERLSPGEVVTLLVPLAQALAAVHAQGVVHGDVTPGNVLLSADGRPLLADLGVSRLLGISPTDVDGTTGFVDPAVAAGDPPSPASDVLGLAATCWVALTGRAPYDGLGRRQGVWQPDPAAAELTAVLESALAADPADRPDPAALSAAAYRAADPEPLRRPGLPLDVRVTPDGEAATYRVRSSRLEPEEPTPTGGGGRRRRPVPGRSPVGRTSVLRRVLVGLLVVAGLALVGLTVASARSGGSGGSPPVPSAAGRAGSSAPVALRSVAPEGPWPGVLRGLDARRSAAFTNADVAGLDRVYVPGSPALRRDRSQLAALVARGLRAEGVRLRPTSVAVRARLGDRVVLRVVDVLAPFRLRSVDSGRVTPSPGRGARTWAVTLQRSVGGWAVFDVAAD